MLWSGGDNDRRAKRFGSSAVLCVSFTDSQNTRDQITSDRIEIEGSNAQWSKCVLYIPWILSGIPNERFKRMVVRNNNLEIRIAGDKNRLVLFQL